MNLYSLYKTPNFLIAVAEVLSKVATFIIIPLSGLFLVTNDFILWALIFPTIQILSGALSFGLPTYLLRSYTKEIVDNKVDSTQIFISFLIISAVSSFVFLIFKGIYIDSPLVSWKIYLILITNSFLLIIQQKYQADKNGVKFFNQTVIWRIGFAIVLPTTYLLKYEASLDLLLNMLLLIQLLLLIVAVYQECLPFKFNFDLLQQKKIFKFGYPLFITGILQYIIYMNGRYFIFEMGMEAEAYAFSIIQSLVGALNLVFAVFVRVYVPHFFEFLSEKKSIDSLSVYKTIMFPIFEIVTVTIFIGLIIFSSLYQASFDEYIFIVTPILIFGELFFLIQIFVINSLIYFNKTLTFLIFNIVLAALSFLLGYMLVNKFGIYGGAGSVALTKLVSVFLAIILMKDLFKSLLGNIFCIEKLIRITFLMLSFFICFSVFGREAVIYLMVGTLCFLVWKFNIPLKMNLLFSKQSS